MAANGGNHSGEGKLLNSSRARGSKDGDEGEEDNDIDIEEGKPPDEGPRKPKSHKRTKRR